MFSREDFSEEESYPQRRDDISGVSFNRFAPGWDRPSPDQLKAWFLKEPILPDGTMPCDDKLTDLHIVLREILAHHDRSADDYQSSISALALSERTFMNPFHIRSLCRQLCTGGFRAVLEEYPKFSTCFRIHPLLEPHKLKRIREQVAPL